MKRKTYRFRRLAAIIIDWNLARLPTIILSALLMPLFKKGLHPLIFIPIWIVFPVLFLHRDRLFKGRSPGNRLMKLTVLDRRTLQPLPEKSMATRNLFFLLAVWIFLFCWSPAPPWATGLWLPWWYPWTRFPPSRPGAPPPSKRVF